MKNLSWMKIMSWVSQAQTACVQTYRLIDWFIDWFIDKSINNSGEGGMGRLAIFSLNFADF